MRTLEAIAILLFLLMGRFSSADGMFMSKEGEVDLTIPDQRAIIVWDRGVQTLFVESSLRAGRGSYSWIIPLPAPPTKIDKVRPSVMDLAFERFEPTIRREPKMEREVASKLLLAVLLCAAVVLYWRKGHPVARLAILIIVPGLCLIFLPVYAGGAKGAGSSDSTVQVLDRQTIGSYEVGVVKSTDAKALEQWLDQAGTPLPANARSIVEDYIKQGWCFMAARFRKDADGAAKPHPIRIQFPAERPIYPMRLTGLVSATLDLDLLVIGPNEAACPPLTQFRHYDVKNTAPAPALRLPARYARHAEIRHVDIASFLPKSAIGTRMRGTVSREQMQSDYEISWRERSTSQPEFYTPEGAPIRGQAAGLAAVALLVWIGTGFALFLRTEGLRRPVLTVLSIALAAAVFGAVVMSTTPTVEVVETGYVSKDMYDVSDAISLAIELTRTPGPEPFPVRFRKELENAGVSTEEVASWERDDVSGYQITQIGKDRYEVKIMDAWGHIERVAVDDRRTEPSE